MNPPPPPFTVSPSTYTGQVAPGGENVGLPSPVFQGLTQGAGLRIDGDPNDSGFSAWWEWALPGPLPAGAYLAHDIQWTSDANYVIARLLGDGAAFSGNEFSMGPRASWQSAWVPQDLRSVNLPAGISTLRFSLSAQNASPGPYALSAIFQRMELYIPTAPVLVGGATYIAGDVVRHNGGTWLAIDVALPGDEPGVSPSWVSVAKDGLNYRGDWPMSS